MKKKQRCILSVDVEALGIRAPHNHIETLIYGRVNGKEYGIGRFMDIADKYGIKMTFFLDFAEYELYGDAILDVGKYIVSRGHDLQVHCHYDLLEKVIGRPAIENGQKKYHTWYDEEESSMRMVKYVTDRYMECVGVPPIAFRGGEYRFGIEFIKALKNHGYKADMSYNFVRPRILSPTSQFIYENGIIEIPVGSLPERKALNFNNKIFIPDTKQDCDLIVERYKEYFQQFADAYGTDAIAVMLFHSWSFMHDKKHFQETGYINRPREVYVEMFERFLEHFSKSINFVTAAEMVNDLEKKQLKTTDFCAALPVHSLMNRNRIKPLIKLIKERSRNRRIIIWGKGWIESTIFREVDINKELNTAFYISNDAERLPIWRGKPVYKSADVDLNPDKDFIFVVARSVFTDIRESLINKGFLDNIDYIDIEADWTAMVFDGHSSKPVCPICGSSEFKPFNSKISRMCSKCSSVERTRTLKKLIDDNLNIDFDDTKVFHISPSNPERLLLKQYGASTTTIDIRPECRVDIVADICDMPQVISDTYDVAVLSYVLNAVYDDEKALKEISRIIKKKGMVLIYVSESEDRLRTINEENVTAWYGEENYQKYHIGTFRYYGETDFMIQLKRHFSSVRCFEKYDDVTDSLEKIDVI